MKLRDRLVSAYATSRGWAERWWRLHSKLSWGEAEAAWRLYREAHDRWWKGEARPTGEAVSMPVPGSRTGRVVVRRGTTDALVYYDVLVNNLYGRFLPERPIMRVLDLGANVGFVSVFLLTRFPECQVVAVEPDPDNAAICRRNLSPFGDRARLVEGAVWARETRVTLAAEHRGTWASSVAVDDHGTIEGHTVAGFLGLLDGGADIVKIDIEGAEEAIFESDDTAWIDRVRCIALEPENQPSLKAFERAIEGRMQIVHRYGDVVFAARTE